MSEAQYTLSATALATVQQDLISGNYPAAYRTIAADLAGRADQDTIAWFTNAAQINNANSQSFIRYFALDYAQAMVASEWGSTANAADGDYRVAGWGIA
jgi:hypothetical protein